MSLLPVEDALTRILSGVETLGSEIVEIARASGRVLAQDIIAQRTQPPFDVSAMDGYAVRHADITSVPASLALIGQSAAGHGFAGSLGSGQAVRIFTGAPLPAGADTVVIQEDTRTDDPGSVVILETIAKGRHIRCGGLDFRSGDILLKAGRILDPAALSLAASGNQAELAVVRRPRVAILATGDELTLPGQPSGPDQIVSSNSYGVAAIVEQCGAVAIDLGIARDTLQSIEDAIAGAIEQKADVLVTLGGASVGDHDLVQAALTARGMKLDFWKLALRPGKPMMFGDLAGMRVLGLPGNPVSSLVCSHIFLKPLVHALGGKRHVADIRQIRLAVDMPENDHRQDYVRAFINDSASVEPTVEPFPLQDSSMLSTLARSDGLIIRKPHAPKVTAGQRVPVLFLR